MCVCPAHQDRTASLSIKQGHTRPLYKCFAGCARETVSAAINDLLGRPVEARQATAAPAQQPNTSFKRIWDSAVPVEGTLAHRYLRDIRKLDYIPPDIRFHPRCPKGRKPNTQFLPALLVGAFRLGNLCAIQRLFLDPSTALRTDRMMLGNSRGAMWPSRPRGERLYTAEGFETACAFEQITTLPASTCFGDANFSVFVPPNSIKAITLLPDNDPEGQAMAADAVGYHSERGLIADIHPCPPTFNDWAEILDRKPKHKAH